METGRPPHRTMQYVVAAVLVALVVGYASTLFLTRWAWSDSPRDRTTVTFSAQTPDGSAPSPDALAQVNETLRKRVDALGLSDIDVAVNADQLSVAATGDGAAALRDIGVTGQVYMRPVIHAIPAKAGPQAPASRSSSPPSKRYPDLAQRIADEKQLRQSTDEQIQLLSLQFQATRCTEEDLLADHDDPNLPLITCSEDNSVVYLLDKSILSGDEIEKATAQFNPRSGDHTVLVSFATAGAQTWADFTRANVGRQVAYAVDTRVVTAPEIREEIADGRTEISGNFTTTSARQLAATLSGGTLPLQLAFESSSTEQVAAPHRTPLRLFLLASGAVVVLALVGGLTYLILSGRRARSDRGAMPTSG